MASDWLVRISPQIHVIWAGSVSSSWFEPARRLYNHQLVVFFNGACNVRIDGDVFLCKKGTFMIIPPGKLHSAAALEGGFSNYSIHFDWAFTGRSFPSRHCVYHPASIPLRELHPAPSFIPKCPMFGEVGREEEVFSVLRKLHFRWISSGRGQRESCRALLLEALILLLSPGVGAHAGYGRSDQLACKVKSFLQDSYLKAISIQKSLRSLGCSHAHLCRIFSRTYGMSPREYLNELRLEHAKGMLLSGSCSVKESALGSGFNDPRYFARIFRRRNGMSPRDFALKFEDSFGRRMPPHAIED